MKFKEIINRHITERELLIEESIRINNIHEDNSQCYEEVDDLTFHFGENCVILSSDIDCDGYSDSWEIPFECFDMSDDDIMSYYNKIHEDELVRSQESDLNYLTYKAKELGYKLVEDNGNE